MKKEQVKKMLNELVNPTLAAEIFKANFPDEIDGYMPGKVLTFNQLSALNNGDIIHIRYVDEDDNVREDGFQVLDKTLDDEWSAGAYAFPVDELMRTPDNKIANCDNSGWSFTIREAVPAKKGEFFKLRNETHVAEEILDKMQELLKMERNTTDKAERKEIKATFKKLEKQLRKITGI